MRHLIASLCIFPALLFAAPGTVRNPDISPTTEDLPPQLDLYTETPDSLTQIESLIKATEANLINQKTIRDRIVVYRKAELNYLQDPDNTTSTAALVNTAHETLTAIEEANLEYVFEADMISELKLFSKIATKQTPAVR